MLDDETAKAMPDEYDWTVKQPVATIVHAVDQLFAAELETSLWSVRVPFRGVVVCHDP